MFSRLFVSLTVLCILSFNVSARNNDNPFAKNETLTIGTDAVWKIDKKAVLAVKSSGESKGIYYHLQFDNKQLELMMSSDAQGDNPKKFSQLEIKNVEVDGKQLPLFKWCLSNQERHNRFLQQGLKVKKNICVIDSGEGTFIMRLNKATLAALQNGRRMSIMLKPFRTPLDLNYDISDFKGMYTALNAKPEPAIAVAAPVPVSAPVSAPVIVKAPVVKPVRKCWAGAPPQYRNIKSVGYNCDDAAGKQRAEMQVSKSVNQEKEKQRKLAAEKEKQRKLVEQEKQKALAEKEKQEKLLQAEAAAIAASQAKQAKISDEISMKMIKVCEKYWNKGEHRCYCQKYIEHAPASIQESSTCD